MILYSIVKFFTKIVFRIFYRKIYVEGLEHVPENGPGFVCSNHPNGFVEPMLIGSFIKDAMYFLMRGDLFDVPGLGWFLRNSRQIPIFRSQDGVKALRGNQESMKFVNQVLKQGNKVLIFPEGGTEPVKHLRPLKKGVARMAFEFLENDPKTQLYLLPISVIFTENHKIRSSVYMTISQPIIVNNYLKEYTDNKARAIKSLLLELKNRIEANVIQLTEENDVNLYNELSPLLRKDEDKISTRVKNYNSQSVVKHVNLSKKIILCTSNEKLEWQQKIRQINLARNEAKLYGQRYYLGKNKWFDYVLLLLGFIPAILGYVYHFIPASISLLVANKYSKDGVFWSSLLGSVSLITNLIYYFFTGLVGTIFFGVWGLLAILALILCGWFYFVYKYYFIHVTDKYKWNQFPQKDEIDQIITELYTQLT